jgi:hypothetical protein
MLSDVSIVITAGSRPGYLKKALQGIRLNLPECTVIVVNDDGCERTPGGFLDTDVIWREMPKDTFLTRKRNAGVELACTKYTLLAADDFEFDIESRATVIRMTEILNQYTLPDAIAGSFNNKNYQGSFVVKEGEYIKEVALDTATAMPLASGRTKLWKVEIAVNFFLARTKALRDVPWDETMGPIGGEHADWYLDMKAANKVIAWTPGLNINEQPKDVSKEHPDYGWMRKRCWDGHALMLKKRGVKKYYGFDEEVK